MTRTAVDLTERETPKDGDERDETRPVPRAPTRQDTPNSYQLQLSSAELEELQRALRGAEHPSTGRRGSISPVTSGRLAECASRYVVLSPC
ncbi:MAG: hypothetical protein JWN04_902 [Myxococcaceae bacterium]|nr:hypothetical protein [Myxococcaceae bacterium]